MVVGDDAVIERWTIVLYFLLLMNVLVVTSFRNYCHNCFARLRATTEIFRKIEKSSLDPLFSGRTGDHTTNEAVNLKNVS